MEFDGAEKSNSKGMCLRVWVCYVTHIADNVVGSLHLKPKKKRKNEKKEETNYLLMTSASVNKNPFEMQ